MDFNQRTWDSLRAKGYDIGDFYVQAGVGPAGGRMYVVVNGVAMSFADARSLAKGIVTLGDIAKKRTA